MLMGARFYGEGLIVEVKSIISMLRHEYLYLTFRLELTQGLCKEILWIDLIQELFKSFDLILGLIWDLNSSFL
jgi:hypothetical protein